LLAIVEAYRVWALDHPDLYRLNMRGRLDPGPPRGPRAEVPVPEPPKRRTPMSTTDRLQIVRDCYRAYAEDDRSLLEPHIAGDLVYSAPPDVGIDRATYFERCWANRGHLAGFAFVRLVEVDDEVLVTYESTRTDGTRFRNTEILRFAGDQVDRIEVYFGWELE
ncbi:hypothetical protein AB0L40_24465, partial [Patulibacter sp. NPDC049589]|uniref:hypothetical protein n=1 Tax=Patulibacter sp. NPDC049589 TaxID=3154731 RepID=UPI00342D5971